MFNALSVKRIAKHRSHNGYEIDALSNQWVLDRQTIINLDFLTHLAPEVSDPIRWTLLYYAESLSGAHTYNMCTSIKSYFDYTGESSITEIGLLKYKKIVGRKEDRLGSLRVFLKASFFLQFGLIDNKIYEFLISLKLKGNPKGVVVKSLCPEEGPYSDIEYEAILYSLNSKYAEEIIADGQYALAGLFAFSGRRPIQIAALKVKDFKVDVKLLGFSIYLLNIPRAKVRNGFFRCEFTPFGLDESFAQVLALHIENVVLYAESIFKRKLSQSIIGELPLFPSDIDDFKDLSDEDLLAILKTSDVCHSTSLSIVDELKNTIDLLGITSERTGRPLITTAYRFRYTVGTRAAREGLGLVQIATLLDQSDTQNVKVYVANIPEHAREISHFMNNALMRYASAFQGTLQSGENSGDSRIIRTVELEHEIGGCGTKGFCYDFAPIACYVCNKFKPWYNAPHHIVLDWLLRDRARVLNSTGDAAIAAINDRCIVAVIQVIELCRNYTGER